MAQFKVDQNLIDETFGANTTPTAIHSQIDTVQPSPVQKDTFNVADTLEAIPAGVESAAHGLYETGRGLGEVVGVQLPEWKQRMFHTETLVGDLTKDIVQFGVGLLPGAGALKGVGLASKLGKGAKELTTSAVGTGLVADPDADRLSNVIQQTGLANPINEFLSRDGDDSILVSKLKAAAEDVLTTGAALSLINSLKILKYQRTGNKEGLEQAVKDQDSLIKNAENELNPGTVTKSVSDNVMNPTLPKQTNIPATKAEGVKESGEQVPVFTGSQSGESLFKLSKEEAQQFDAHVNFMVGEGRYDGVFDTPTFKAFNDSRNLATVDTKEVLESMANFIKPKLAGRPVETLEETKKLADFLGADQTDLYRKLQQASKTADELPAVLVAAKGYSVQLARDIRKLSTSVNKGDFSEATKEALDSSVKRLADVLGMTQTLKRGTARAVSAGRIFTTEKDLYEFADLVRLAGVEGDDLTSLSKIVGVVKGETLGSKILKGHNTWWFNAVLSSPKTHLVNMIGTGVQTLALPSYKALGGLLRGDAEAVIEGFATYRGMLRQFTDSISMASQSLKNEKVYLDPGNSTDEIIRNQITKTGKDSKIVENATGFLTSLIKMPTRLLGAEDEFFKQLNYRSLMDAKLSRQAAQKVREGTLEREKVGEWIAGRLKETFDVNGKGLDTEALDYAQRATFTNSLKVDTHLGGASLGERVQLLSSNPLLKGTVLPFIKVPVNLMRSFGELTPPLALLRKDFWNVMKGEDQIEKSILMGKIAVGSMFWTTAIAMAVEGRITGGAYGDKTMKDRQLESGWQPYSVVITSEDGKKQYVSFQRMDPFGMFFGLAADFAYITHHLENDERNEWGAVATLALAKNLSSKSYLSGLNDALNVVVEGDEHKFARFIQNRAASYIPNYVGVFNGDDELKNIQDWTDALKSKVPGISETVAAKRDYFGQKRTVPMGRPWHNINPFTINEENDQVRSELSRLSRGAGEARFTLPPEKIGTIDLTQVTSKKTGQSAHDRWLEIMGTLEIGGKTFHQKLQEIMETEAYKNGSDGNLQYKNGSRTEQIRRVQELYRDRAKKQLLREFKLNDAIREDKINKNRGARGEETNQSSIKDLIDFGGNDYTVN